MGRCGEIWGDSGRTSRGRGRSYMGRSRAPMGDGSEMPCPARERADGRSACSKLPRQHLMGHETGTGDEVRGPARLSRSLDFRLRCATTTRHRLARALLLRVVAKHVRHRQPPVPGGRAAAEGLSDATRPSRDATPAAAPHAPRRVVRALAADSLWALVGRLAHAPHRAREPQAAVVGRA